MISICVPIYNFNVSALVSELSKQAQLLNVPNEIILIDDCSSASYKEINKEICSQQHYIQLEKNIGRSKIRNLFLEYAHYDNLLFLDCDSLLISNDFLTKYIQTIRDGNYSVCCGGRVYPKEQPGRNKILRWKYGVKSESQPLHVREKAPNKSFMTNNFLVKRELLETIKFDERIMEYGHEDTLFGFQLKKRGLTITHIDNPVLNGDLEDNAEYLDKTEKGIKNLSHIVSYVNNDADFINDVTLLEFYEKLKSLKIVFLIRLMFYPLKPILKLLLANGCSSMLLFNFYKIGILCGEAKKR